VTQVGSSSPGNCSTNVDFFERACLINLIGRFISSCSLISSGFLGQDQSAVLLLHRLYPSFCAFWARISQRNPHPSNMASELKQCKVRSLLGLPNTERY
jgi:hypothetical protein